jgi:zinc transport system permease protein
MFDDFLFRGFLGGIGVAIVAGPLGCFVVWQRMSYFGAAIAHAALLGVALGFLFNVEPLIGILVVAVLFAMGIFGLQRHTYLASDTVLGIFAHVSLALGVIVVSFMENLRLDLMGYLFGDILAVGQIDLIWIYVGGAISLGVLMMIWRSLLAMTVHEELAAAEGVAVERTRLLFTLLLAMVIAIAMKIVGILLIISMLIIPAAAARSLTRTPERMALMAILLGVLSVTGGLGASLHWDTASGPSIVVVAFGLFLLARAFASPRWRKPGSAP